MIDEIHVRNLALIEEASIRPSAGMTVITGETGAGKTALLASCKLLMGQRADHDMIREGEREAEVQGRLFIPEDRVASDEAGFSDCEPDAGGGSGAAAASDAAGASEPCEREIVADRRVSADGRSHVRINGRMASVSELASTVSPSIDLCSQHDQQLLSKPATQRRYLDVWAGVEAQGLSGRYRQAFADANEAARALQAVKEIAASSDARVEDARFKLGQIDSVGPSQEDYDELMASLRKAENAELLARSSGETHEALSGEGGALDGLNVAIALLDAAAGADESLKPLADSLREATYIAEDVAHDVARYKDAIDLDVSSLEQMQERAAAYQSLMRAYGPGLEGVLAVAEESRSVIAAVEDSGAALRQSEGRLREAEGALAVVAEELSEARASAAPGFAEAVTAAMSELQMGGAALVLQVDRLPREAWTEGGPDDVRFMFRPGAGMQARPLSRIASGGELSRVMLALHAVMGARDEVPTLVFDEIDAGVGGAVALALADVLARLAHTHQVIVVTHLPQVAAKASVHYVASKHLNGGVASTHIREVSGGARTEEIARMLSGAITESSLEHARELQNM